MDPFRSIESVLAIVAGGSGGYLAALFGLQTLAHFVAIPAMPVTAAVLGIAAVTGARWSMRKFG